jgi:hypothetical protein
MALAKLSAAAAGGALIGGGAVHVAEPMSTDTPVYKSDKMVSVSEPIYIKDRPAERVFVEEPR